MNKEKVFIVSNNKCATSSFKNLLSGHFAVAPQGETTAIAHHLLGLTKVPRAIGFLLLRRLIERYGAFQDQPFSYKFLLPWLVKNYPNQKFIHVQRDEMEWYQSLVQHHIFRRLGLEPVFDDRGSLIWTQELEEAMERRPLGGFPLYERVMARFGTSRANPYEIDALVAYHAEHTRQGRELLSGGQGLLLRIEELGSSSTHKKVEEYLGLKLPPIPRSNIARR